ncbi:hypothetical protein ES708_31046 [subsurface metagenome]
MEHSKQKKIPKERLGLSQEELETIINLDEVAFWAKEVERISQELLEGLEKDQLYMRRN